MLHPCRPHVALALIVVAFAAGCTKVPTAPSEAPEVSAPIITSHPRSHVVSSGASVTLSVAATGTGTMGFQWYVGAAGETSAPVAGADGASYTTPALTSTTRYWVRVAASGRTADSDTATVAVDAVAPTILEQPEDDTVEPGHTAHLEVEATGSEPFAYQWFRGVSGSTADPVVGATEWTLTTPALSDTTAFWVRVSNPAGSVDSRTATVTVMATPSEPTPPTPPPTPPPAPPAPAPTPPPPPPVPTPPASDPTATAFENEVLGLINQRRAAGATCGGTAYPPAGALAMNETLRSAARAHSQDMATRNYFSHTSLDGRTFLQRMRDTGYNGSGPHGENIAAGYGSAAAAVSGWMSSTGHCQNIMNAGFRVAGVGYAYGAGSTYGVYWTMNFGGN